LFLGNSVSVMLLVPVFLSDGWLKRRMDRQYGWCQLTTAGEILQCSWGDWRSVYGWPSVSYPSSLHQGFKVFFWYGGCVSWASAHTPSNIDQLVNVVPVNCVYVREIMAPAHLLWSQCHLIKDTNGTLPWKSQRSIAYVSLVLQRKKGIIASKQPGIVFCWQIGYSSKNLCFDSRREKPRLLLRTRLVPSLFVLPKFKHLWSYGRSRMSHAWRLLDRVGFGCAYLYFF
jgi:hypothetical protein